MTKARLLYLLGSLSVLAFNLGFVFRPAGLSDGGCW
jgi:hypothetical protein